MHDRRSTPVRAALATTLTLLGALGVHAGELRPALAETAAVEKAAPRVDAPEVDRLVALAQVWGTVDLFHPRLATERLDWDAPLLQAIPRARAAASDAELAEVVGRMLAVLGDPVTTVRAPASAQSRPAVSQTAGMGAAAGAAGPGPAFRRERGVLVIGLRAVGEQFVALDRDGLRALVAALKSAGAVVVDCRGPDDGLGISTFVMSSLAPLLVASDVSGPALRTVVWSGWPGQGTAASGFYRGFEERAGETFSPDVPGRAPRPIAFVVGDGGGVPALAVAMRHARQAVIVAGEGWRDAAAVREVALPGGFTAQVRVAESAWSTRPDVTVGVGRDALAVALDVVLGGKARPPAPADARLAPPIAPWAPAHPGEGVPPVEVRLLTAFRLWNVVDHFYAYPDLAPGWSSSLAEVIPRVVAASDEAAWASTLAAWVARIPDAHTTLAGVPGLARLQPMVPAPVEVRIVGGIPLVTRLLDDAAATAAGLRVGDEVVAVDGMPAAEMMRLRAPYQPAATAAARTQMLAGALLAGADTAPLRATVRDASGVAREVTVPHDPSFYWAGLKPRGKAWRLVTPDVGYVDLTMLERDKLEPMLDELAATKALVLDMRGYPRATGFLLAPMLNVRGARFGARVGRPQLVGLPDQGASNRRLEFTADFMPGPAPRYRGKTVMLVDDRTVSQAEHTALFLEAAAATTFVGTATAGTNGDVTTLALPRGVTLSFTGHDIRHADGRRLQGLGVQPDLVVEPTVAGIRTGRDEVLERALQWIRAGK